MLNPTMLLTVRDAQTHKLEHHQIEYRNYRELCRDLKRQLDRSVDGLVSVARSRRGQGFEWFETWTTDFKGKPIKTKEGWQ